MTPRDLVVTRWGARYLGRDIACAVGRGGITHTKHEGDSATPAGVFHMYDFVSYYRPDRYAGALGQPLRRNFIWSDDQHDPGYNRLGILTDNRRCRYSHERLWRGDGLYDLIIDIGYNANPAQSGKGSAIFIHRWRKPRHPTEGCIAFSNTDLHWIVERMNWCDRLIIR